MPLDGRKGVPRTLTLLLAWSGESFMLSAVPIWVQQIAIGISLNQAAEQ